MGIHADQVPENKNKSVADLTPDHKSGSKSILQFVDNRPEAVAQRKLQRAADNSTIQREPFDKDGNDLGIKGQAYASNAVDSGVQKIAHSGVSTWRDSLHKFQPEDPNDWLPTRMRKYVYHKGVDVVGDNFNRIADTTKGFFKGIGDKVIPSTMDRLNPSHIVTALSNPRLAHRYLSQRKDQLLQPWYLYKDPRGFLQNKWNAGKNSLSNGVDRFSELDGGLRNKTAHGGRAFVDMIQGGIAPVAGLTAATFALYNRPGPRKKTSNAFNSMFPRGTMRGVFAREPLTKFMFTNPIAKIRGNPVLSAGLLSYLLMTNMGKSIRESQELKQRHPNTYGRLEENNRDVVGAGRQIGLMDSIVSTSQQTE